MKKLGALLEKFKKVLDLDEENKEIIIDAIFQITKEKIPPQDLKIQNNTLFIRANPYVKREIISRKKKILQILNENLINLTIKDIK